MLYTFSISSIGKEGAQATHITAISPILCDTVQIIVPDNKYPKNIAAGPPEARLEPEPSQRPMPMDEPRAIMVMCLVLRRLCNSDSAPWSSMKRTSPCPWSFLSLLSPSKAFSVGCCETFSTSGLDIVTVYGSREVTERVQP